MSRHDTLKTQWARGQYWETLVEGCLIWVPVGHHGYAQPLWNQHQEYRRRPDLEKGPCDDAEAIKLWMDAGMPPYLLSRPGDNHGLVRFLTLARQAIRPAGVTVVCGSSAPRPACTVCGVPYEKHGTYPTCASHPYTPDGTCQHVVGATCVGAECTAGCVRGRL